MARKKDISYRSIKKNHAWVWLIVLSVLMVVTAVLVGMFISIFATSIVSDKYEAERSSVQYMAQVLEICEKDGTDPYAILGGLGRDHMVTDKEHNVLYTSGTDTCVFRTGPVPDNYFIPPVSIPAKGSVVYSDASDPGLFGTEDDTVSLNVVSMLGDVEKYIVYTGEKDENKNDLPDIDEKMFSIPMWIGIDISGGRQFVARSYINVDVFDLISLLILVAGIGLLTFIIFTMTIVNIVSSIVRSRRTLKVFFSDAVTQGNNMMYFVIKGGEMLRKRYNAANKYAVVNLTFVYYHNFCVCHSVEDGERMLCRMYDIISGSLGKREMCAHCGSGEFALLLLFTDDDELLQRVRALISMLEKVDADHKFGFHAGITVVPPDGTSAPDGKEIRRRSIDLETEYTDACTASRTLGYGDDSGVAFFDDKLVEEQKWTDKVGELQERALANEEFLVYYQPKYDPRTNVLRGAEALIRWQSPEFGLIPPGRFIPIFETNGFITEIDHYMLKHAARDQKAWLDKGLQCVPVSVNVSRAHFIEEDLAEQICSIVDKEGTPHELIEIELTESAFFDDKKAMITTINKLKEYGFAVSMDDFGSGYSSLNSLKDMPLDVLKLDAEFFRGETDAERAEKVISEAIKLAKTLNMRTVAEGVEIREQVDFLAAQGCDMIQGYYYSKPLPKAEFEERVAAHKA